MGDLKIRMELEPKVLGLDKLNHLEIAISHDKGGMSWGTGEYRSCGVRCDVHPLEVTYSEYNGVKHEINGRVFDGKTEHQGFFVHLIDCQKKSPKKMQMAFDKIKPHANEVKDLFIAGKYNKIADLLVKVVNE